MKIKAYWMTLLFLAVQLAAVLWLGYTLPPDRLVPSHWDIHGNVNGWMSRDVAIWVMYGVSALIGLSIVAMPLYSVRYREHEEAFRRVMPRLSSLLVGFFAILHVLSLWLAHHPYSTSGSRYIMLVIGLFFVGLGNLMPKIPGNFVAGVRTPWTLSSERVWRRTARVAAWGFVLAGLGMMVEAAFEPVPQWVAFVVVLPLLLSPMVLSFVFWLQDRRQS